MQPKPEMHLRTKRSFFIAKIILMQAMKREIHVIYFDLQLLLLLFDVIKHKCCFSVQKLIGSERKMCKNFERIMVFDHEEEEYKGGILLSFLLDIFIYVYLELSLI